MEFAHMCLLGGVLQGAKSHEWANEHLQCGVLLPPPEAFGEDEWEAIFSQA